MSKYIIPVEDFDRFLSDNLDYMPTSFSKSLSNFVRFYKKDETETKETPKINELVENAKKHFKSFMDNDYVDDWMEHNKVFLDKLNEIKEKNGNFFDKIGEAEPIFNKIAENSKSFVKKYTKKNTGSKKTQNREFKCSDMISENGNTIVHWTLVDNDNEYEGFGSKGVMIAKRLQEDGVLEAGELAYIKNIHNFCKAYGKNN